VHSEESKSKESVQKTRNVHYFAFQQVIIRLVTHALVRLSGKIPLTPNSEN